MNSINVFQWNILTQAFCNHYSYPKEDYPKEVLNQKHRYQMILSRIDEAMKAKSVIVLHEVDNKLRGELAVLADAADFGMVSQGHGYWRNWYMGSVIMWPREHFALKQQQHLTVGELIRDHIKNPTPKSGWIDMFMQPFVFTYHWITKTKPSVDCYQEATRRTNVLTHVKLQQRLNDNTMHIWAYHMPCAFKNPPIMQYHADEIVRAINNSEKDSHILCMDGNFKPYSELYNTFIEAGMTSAAFAAFAQEPEWTCHSNSSFGGEFTGTLDYVWHIDTSGPDKYKYQVKFAEIDSPQDEVPYLPTSNFPSDHLWMDVTINKSV
jgi:hypothetical protein